MRVLILARWHDDAAAYAHGRGLQNSAWRYCGSLNDVIGCAAGSRRPKVVVLPGAATHPQYLILRHALEVRNANFTTPAPESPR
jgi:hypothetical protein